VTTKAYKTAPDKKFEMIYKARLKGDIKVKFRLRSGLLSRKNSDGMKWEVIFNKHKISEIYERDKKHEYLASGERFVLLWY
jgi:hypothetical protein